MKVYLIAVMLTGTLMLSCNADQNRQNTTVHDVTLTEPERSEGLNKSKNEVADTTTAMPPEPGILQAGNPMPDWDKKIIKTAHITLELDDYKAYNTSLHSSLKNYGAYVASEELQQNDDRIENVLTIKVPVVQFETLMNSFNADGLKVINKRITTEDVTGEVVDTKARIDAKKQVRARYLELLKQAKNMEEILQVQNEINDIQVDLETADGRVKHLVNQSAYSTIHLVYYQHLNGVTSDNTQPGFFTNLKEAFKNGSYIITTALLFVVTIWPVLLVAFFGWMFFRRYKSNAVSSPKKV